MHRPARQWPRWIGLVAALAALLLGSACSSGGGSRGRVSDVAARSAEEGRTGRGTGRTRTKTDHLERSGTASASEADDDDGDGFLVQLLFSLFSGDDDEETDAWPPPTGTASPRPAGSADYAEVGGAGGAGGDNEAGRRAASPQRRNLILWYSRAGLAGDAIDRVSSVSALYSRYRGPRQRDHLGAFYADGSKGGQPVVRDGIDRIQEVGLDVGSRTYLTAFHTFTGIYVLYGARLSSLHWSYTHRVPVDDGTTSHAVSRDGVALLTPYLGLGCSLVQVRPFHLGLSGSWGPRISLFRTYEGFENDLFVAVGELRWNLELSVFF